jgi:hypothetical protein
MSIVNATLFFIVDLKNDICKSKDIENNTSSIKVETQFSWGSNIEP